jgi:hypothetical protein
MEPTVSTLKVCKLASHLYIVNNCIEYFLEELYYQTM